jgi:carboxymethylenebutenolidase
MDEPNGKAPEITQEMINLYDEFTHITLDRRGFMDRLTALVGSAGTAAVVADMIAGSPAMAQVVKADDPRVKGGFVTYPGQGGDVSGYLVKPANATGKLPSVVVAHQNRGINQHIQDVARRVALEGYLALAVDFLSPLGGTPADEDKARDMFPKLDRAQVIGNSVASLKYLAAHADSNGKVGILGFCWGGGVVNATATAAGELLKCGVAYYGPQPNAADVPKIKAELVLHYAGNDENIGKGIPAYKDALDKAGVKYEMFTYPGVQHAFNDDSSVARFNKEAADLAWSRTFAAFKRTLA